MAQNEKAVDAIDGPFGNIVPSKNTLPITQKRSGAQSDLIGASELYADLPAETLARLSQQTRLIRERMARTKEELIEIGRYLQSVKDELPGHFGRWIDAEFGFDQRTAENWINLAAFADQRFESISDMPPMVIAMVVEKLPANALYKFTRKTPRPAIESVIARVESGARVNEQDVADLVRESREAVRLEKAKSTPTGSRSRAQRRLVNKAKSANRRKQRGAENRIKWEDEQRLRKAAAERALAEWLGDTSGQ